MPSSDRNRAGQIHPKRSFEFANLGWAVASAPGPHAHPGQYARDRSTILRGGPATGLPFPDPQSIGFQSRDIPVGAGNTFHVFAFIRLRLRNVYTNGRQVLVAQLLDRLGSICPILATLDLNNG